MFDKSFFQKKQNIFFVILIFFMALAPFFWLDHAVMNINDTPFVFDPSIALSIRSFTWKDLNLGLMQSRGITLLPLYQLPIYLLYKIGFSLTAIQQIVFSYWLFFSGFSFFAFIGYLLRKSKFSGVAGFLAANFYMFNMYSLQFFWHLPIILYVYAFLPLILLYCVKIFEKFSKKDFAILVILILLCSPGINNLLLALIMVILILSYLALSSIIERIILGNKLFTRKKTVNLLAIGLVFFLGWAYIIIPVFLNVFNEIQTAISADSVNLEYIGNASFASVAEGFRFLGHSGFFASYKNFLYYPFSKVYQTSLFIILGFFITILAYLALLICRSSKKYVIIFAIFALVSFLLINGPNSSLGFAFAFLFKHLPYFSIFRNPLDKIGLIFIFSFTCLFALSVNEIITRLHYAKFAKIKSRYFSWGFVVLVFVIINIASFPFITGRIFPDSGDTLFSNKVEIPSYYRDASDYLNKQKNKFRVYILPMQYTYNSTYLWDYAGPDPLSQYLRDRCISTFFKSQQEPMQNMLINIRNDNNFFYKLARLSGLFNIKNVILENDVDSVFYEWITSPLEIKKKLNDSADVVFIRSFGLLDIYKIFEDNFLPLFYTPTAVVVANQETSYLPDIVSQPDYKIRSAVYFTEQNKGKTLNNILSNLETYGAKIDASSELRVLFISFEDGLWQKEPGDCTKGMKEEPIFNTVLSDDATDGRYSLEIGSKNHYACVAKVFPIELSGRNKIYKLSFDYKNVKGDRAEFYYNLTGKERSYSFSKSIEIKNHDWNHYETIIKPAEDISGITLYFYASSDGSNEVINRFDNIKLVPLELKLYRDFQASETIQPPAIEFNKVNPIKYIVRVHQARANFPIVFSESFNKWWKVYLVNKFEGYKAESKYNIIEGNEADQASKEELLFYVDKGWLSALGDGFISKNLQGTIQNDNLAKGHFWDSWLKKPLSEENHLLVNGYANSWLINLNDIKKSGKYIQNSDGSIDFELVVEFWPQRLFCLGLLISGITLLACLGYLVYSWKKSNKKL